eukprot:SAG22_NODE_1248_length_5014_cov_9.812004_3_plen_84_part_00
MTAPLALRLPLARGSTVFAPVLTGLPKLDYDNLKADAQLSVAIGGATGCFVGTDVSYADPSNAYGATDSNWLRPIIGIEDGGC